MKVVDSNICLVSHEKPLWGTVTFHRLGLFISGSFGLGAVCVASFLLLGHATHYSKPWEQRQYVRVGFAVYMRIC